MRKILVVLAAMLLVEGRLRAQQSLFTDLSLTEVAPRPREPQTISEIRFLGLRRISPEALRMRLESRVGEPVDNRKVEHDIRNIARLGWFSNVRADVQSAGNGTTSGPSSGCRLIFFAQESPFLTAVTYRGSRLLSPKQIHTLLAEQKLEPKIGEPENPVTLNLAAHAIESALAELAHPRAKVDLLREVAANATERVQFEIEDGPRISVGRIAFEGNSGVREKTLRRRMQSLAPGALFAGFRGKDAYTPAAFEADRSQMLAYLWTHGYPKAQIGAAEISEYEQPSRHQLPWRVSPPQRRLAIAIPVEAGSFDPQSQSDKRSGASAYAVRRLEFVGLRRFPDRYLRKRIGVTEAAPFDERSLEAGLRRLARTGYFKPIQKKDVNVQPDEASHTLAVTIHVEESGRQRLSLDGGPGQFGSTLGIAYSLFNIFDREELLTSRIECGPEMLQLAIGFAKEGFLGSRGSLALSLLDAFLRPRFSGGVKGPFFNQRSEGANATYQYAVSNVDTLSAEYVASNSLANYSPAASSILAVSSGTQTHSSSRSVALGWARDRGIDQVTVTSSASGGLLGGSENLVRTKLEYSRLLRDPIFNPGNAWAVRTTFAGVGSYSGPLPLASRFFASDAYVRGLHDGDLGPLAIAASISSSGEPNYSAVPSGANLISAANGEYRWRLTTSTEAVGFFDVGSGRLLPNWLGPSRPSLFQSTNALLRASTGVELRWTLPAIGVPLRGYYALNLFHPARLLTMPDGSLLYYQTHWSALGWGLGSFF